MHQLRIALPLILATVVGCSGETEETESNWWEDPASLTDTAKSDTDSYDKDDKGDDDDTGKGDGEAKNCDDDFDPTASCEGDWTTTLCLYDGMYYWCENGAWKNENDK